MFKMVFGFKHLYISAMHAQLYWFLFCMFTLPTFVFRDAAKILGFTFQFS